MMQICTPDDGVRSILVSKRQGAAYRAARDAEWGGEWVAERAGGSAGEQPEREPGL
jgi:ribosomal protein RSM22 (predicted rRNA methylase)